MIVYDFLFFFFVIGHHPESTLLFSSAGSEVYKRRVLETAEKSGGGGIFGRGKSSDAKSSFFSEEYGRLIGPASIETLIPTNRLR